MIRIISEAYFLMILNFLEQIVAILRQHIGSPIAEIGSLNIPC
jgi:hypothetical protein